MKEICNALKESTAMLSRITLDSIRRKNRDVLCEVQAEHGDAVKAKVILEMAKEKYDEGFGEYVALSNIALILYFDGMLSKAEYADIKSVLEQFNYALNNAKPGVSLWWSTVQMN